MMWFRVLSVAAIPLFLSAFSPAPPQDDPDGPDIDFEFKVARAIEKGVEGLKGRSVPNTDKDHRKHGDALILLTYVHAGVDPNDQHFQKLLKAALEEELHATYGVCLIAMSLEELDRVKYQWRIHQCAQFLVDSMTKEGKIRYGSPTKLPEPPEEKDVKTGSGKKSPPENHPAGEGAKPKVVRKIPVKQQRVAPSSSGRDDHDHSNMQYLCLGLRACHDAGISFPPALIRGIQAHLKELQEDNSKVEPLGLAPMDDTRKSRTKAGIRVNVAPQGWGYSGEARKSEGQSKKDPKQAHLNTKGSMTAGSVGALCICSYMLGEDWKKDRDVLEGLQWLNKYFTVEENPFQGKEWHYYYLYGLERAGMLYGTRLIGDHDWYREGAVYLLKNQGADGTWQGGVINTCFAILFLKKATRQLVRTGRSR